MKRVIKFILKKILKPGYVVFPPIKTQEDINDLLYKLSYMFPQKKIYYSGLKKSTAVKPGYLGDIRLSGTIYNVSRFKLILYFLTFRIVLVWNCRNPLLKIMTLFPHIFNIDRRRNRQEGWQYFYAYNLSAETGNVPGVLFNFERLPKKPKCYAFGTGQSLETAYNYNFDDGYRVICNSMIKNLALMEHIKPDFLVFADAIYHFGPSIYAFAFRDALFKFMERFPSCRILMPENLLYHFSETHTHAKHNIFIIPRCNHKKINIDLKKECCYHRFENILNLLILPVASTLADNIYLLGFDGRSRDSERFWKYSNKNNFIDLIPLQELAHPGFFAGRNYRSDSENLAELTEKIMQYGERMGKSYYSLSPSNNKSVNKRFPGPSLPPLSETPPMH